MKANIEFADIVKPELAELELIMRAQADDQHHEIQAALNIILESGGKRIRPTITFLVGKILNAPKKELLNMSAAIELLHTATLVHDDLIDGSLLRRGMPTLNAQWSPGATVLTGDFIFARAATLAAAANSIPVMKTFSETLGTIVNGEISQLFNSRWNVKRENYFSRIYAKTASLFETSASTAAMISNANEEQISSMGKYGRNIGIGFQIIDDILDFSGSQRAVGKPIGSDLRMGIITLPAILFIENHSDDDDVQFILNKNTNKEFDDGQIERLIKKINASSEIETAKNEAQDYIDKGIEAIKSYPASPEKNALEDIARFIIERRI